MLAKLSGSLTSLIHNQIFMFVLRCSFEWKCSVKQFKQFNSSNYFMISTSQVIHLFVYIVQLCCFCMFTLSICILNLSIQYLLFDNISHGCDFNARQETLSININWGKLFYFCTQFYGHCREWIWTMYTSVVYKTFWYNVHCSREIYTTLMWFDFTVLRS